MNELIPQLAEYPQWASIAGSISFVAFVMLGVSILPTMHGKNRKRAKVASIILALLAVAALVSTFLFLGYSKAARDANDEKLAETVQAREEWVESHGVNVKKDTLENLDFPDTEPKADEEFGIAQVTKDKAVIDITLAWEDGEFVLYGTDGQPMEVLDR